MQKLLLVYYYYSENRATSRIWKVLPNMVFPPIWGKKWRRSEHAHASYPGLSFHSPGFSPYTEGGKKGSSGTGLGKAIKKTKTNTTYSVASSMFFSGR